MQELGQGRDAGQVASRSPSADARFPGMSWVHGATAGFPEAGAGSGLCGESRSAFKHRLRLVLMRSRGKAAHPHLASAAKHLSALPAAASDTPITTNLGVK